MGSVVRGLPWIAAAIIAAVIVWKVGLDFGIALFISGLFFFAFIASLVISEHPETRRIRMEGMAQLAGDMAEVKNRLESIEKILSESRDLLKRIAEELSE